MFERKSPSIPEQIQQRAEKNRKMVFHRRLVGYAYDLFTHAPLYTHWQNFLSYIRRFRTIAFTLRVLTVILTILETGALVILSTAVFLVILPILIALMLGTLLTALLESRRSNRLMKQELDGHRVYVLFLTEKENPFLWQNAKSLAALGANVLILSPYWISSKGLRKGNFYCTVRKEYNRIFLIRRYYFFSLRKQVLNQLDVAYLY